MIDHPIEREWTDKFGTHWSYEKRGPSGALHSVTLTKHRHLGWPDRSQARAEVDRAALERG